jgi:hypothetical protein
MRGKDWPQFLDLPYGVVGETQMAYVKGYVPLYVLSSSEFQVRGGQLQIYSFHREEVMCLCLIILTLSHTSSDG